MTHPQYVLVRDGGTGPRQVGSLYDLPAHGQVCLHTEDLEVVRLLESKDLLAPGRPPYLDAGPGDIHGSYRTTPQINLFFKPPIDAVAEAISSTLREAGYIVAEAAPAGR